MGLIGMATLTIDIPDELKNRCEHAFAGQSLEQILARLLQDALEQETVRQRQAAADRLLARRATAKPASSEEIRAARLAGRP